MFLTVLFAVAKIWKQPRGPSVDEWLKMYVHIHTHTMEYYPAVKENEVLPYAAIWMDLEGIMLSAINQRDNTV